MDDIVSILEHPWARASAILIGSGLLAWGAHLALVRGLGRLTAKTATDLDDRLVDKFKRPVAITVVILGIAWALGVLKIAGTARFVVYATLKTVAIVLWARALVGTSRLLFDFFVIRQRDRGVLQARTVPLFDIVAKIVVVGGSLYFAFLAWKIDVTGWLASAGIVGIAVGFAAKDTLANLFAGIFIIADAPYKIGDWIVIEGERGRVTDIGLRSTRVLTRDDVEVTVPNALIANARIVNESGGPNERTRLRVPAGVAYGTDVDQAREVLMSCTKDLEHVAGRPSPRVNFIEMADSALVFDVVVWLEEPRMREIVVDRLNTRIYKALGEAGIGIPFPQRDIYIKELPEGVRKITGSG